MELPPAQVCMVRGTLAFVLRLSQILGIASLKFERFGKGWHIRASKTATIYGITFIVVMCVLMLLAWILQSFDIGEKSTQNYSNFLSLGIAAILLALLFSEIYFKLYRMKHIITCLSEVQKINAELSQYAVHESNEQIQSLLTIWTLLGGSITFTMECSVLLLRILAHPNSGFILGMQLSLQIVFVMVKVLNLQISLIITTVLSSYTHLNECLKNLLQKIWKESTEANILASLPKSRLNANGSPKNINTVIDSLGISEYIEDRASVKSKNTNDVILNRLGFLYCILHDVVQQLDNSHGLFLVLLITSHFINLAVSLYNFFDFIINKEDYYDLFIWFLWTVSSVSDMLIIIEPSHQTCQQVKRTKHLISQLMLSTPIDSHAVNSELNLFYKNLLFNEVSYSPMKMFKLNRTIITVVTGSIITYLVVILQL